MTAMKKCDRCGETETRFDLTGNYQQVKAAKVLEGHDYRPAVFCPDCMEAWVLQPRGGILLFTENRHRDKAIRELTDSGFNSFIRFKDVDGLGLQYGWAWWVKEGRVSVQ